MLAFGVVGMLGRFWLFTTPATDLPPDMVDLVVFLLHAILVPAFCRAKVVLKSDGLYCSAHGRSRPGKGEAAGICRAVPGSAELH